MDDQRDLREYEKEWDTQAQWEVLRGSLVVGRPVLQHVWRIAAVLVIGLASVGGWYWMQKPTADAIVYSAARGQRTTVRLADGTVAMLAPESQLRLTDGYGRTTREVQLIGEAYFRVRHDAQHPFAVRAGQAIVRDVGTQFDIRAYTGDPDMRVAVAEGAVALVGAGRGNGATGYSGRSFDLGTVSRTRPSSPPNMPPLAGNFMMIHPSFPLTMLGAGDMAVIHDDGVPIVTDHADVNSLAAWQQGELLFDDAPVPEAIRQIERTYDIQVVLKDSSLATDRVTGRFAGNESMTEVLDDIARSIGARVEWRGRSATLVAEPPTSISHPREQGSRPAPNVVVENQIR